MDALVRIDAALLDAIRGLPHPDCLNGVFVLASMVGVGGLIWLTAGAVLALTRQIPLRGMLRLLLAIALVHGVVDLGLKPLVGRQRPAPPDEIQLRLIERPATASFPSGHAANAFAGALVITRLWPKGRFVVWAAAVIVAVARVYLGVHYPLDAVAGVLVGLVIGWIALHARVPSRR